MVLLLNVYDLINYCHLVYPAVVDLKKKVIKTRCIEIPDKILWDTIVESPLLSLYINIFPDLFLFTGPNHDRATNYSHESDYNMLWPIREHLFI